MTIRVEPAGQTHVGLVRKRNEDALYVGRWLFAVADGLGGHVAGDVASRTVIEAIRSHDQLVDEHELAPALARTVNAANEALRRRINDEPELTGMGSTLVALLWSGSSIALANVGDSRAYLLRGRGSASFVTAQLTEDHTYEHLVAGAARVPNLPERMSRWLDGRSDGRSPDLSVRALRVGARYLLCSDGLSSYVLPEHVHEVLTSSAGPAETADRLVQLAIDQGGPDNVTVIVLDTNAH